jgi:hypothetical protein
MEGIVHLDIYVCTILQHVWAILSGPGRNKAYSATSKISDGIFEPMQEKMQTAGGGIG